MAGENRIAIGTGNVEVVVLDQISIDHLYENQVAAAVYSVVIGEDHIPEVDSKVLDYLLEDNE